MADGARITAVQMAVVAALVGYWAVLPLVPVPGIGPGVLTPEGNLASFIDRALLDRHLLNPHDDPEGLLTRCRRLPRRCAASSRVTG